MKRTMIAVVLGIGILSTAGCASPGTPSTPVVALPPARLGGSEASFTAQLGAPDSQLGQGWYRLCGQSALPEHVWFNQAGLATSIAWQFCAGATPASWLAEAHPFLPSDAALTDQQSTSDGGAVMHYTSALLGQAVGTAAFTLIGSNTLGWTVTLGTT